MVYVNVGKGAVLMSCVFWMSIYKKKLEEEEQTTEKKNAVEKLDS